MSPLFIGFATPKLGLAPDAMSLTPFFRPNALICSILGLTPVTNQGDGWAASS